MFELNATIVIFILSFLLFMVLLDNLFLTPVGEAIESRSNKISGDNKKAQELRDDAKAVVEKYEKNLAEIREEAQSIINKSMGEAQKQRSEKLAAIESDGRAKFDEAKNSFLKEKESLVGNLVEEETRLVSEIVSKLLGSSKAVEIEPAQVQKALEEAC